MKNLICLCALGMQLSFCSRVTTQPDTQATTSGTMGSVKATTTLPATADSTKMADSLARIRDSVNAPR